MNGSRFSGQGRSRGGSGQRGKHTQSRRKADTRDWTKAPKAEYDAHFKELMNAANNNYLELDPVSASSDATIASRSRFPSFAADGRKVFSPSISHPFLPPASFSPKSPVDHHAVQISNGDLGPENEVGIAVEGSEPMTSEFQGIATVAATAPGMTRENMHMGPLSHDLRGVSSSFEPPYMRKAHPESRAHDPEQVTLPNVSMEEFERISILLKATELQRDAMARSNIELKLKHMTEREADAEKVKDNARLLSDSDIKLQVKEEELSTARQVISERDQVIVLRDLDMRKITKLLQNSDADLEIRGGELAIARKATAERDQTIILLGQDIKMFEIETDSFRRTIANLTATRDRLTGSKKEAEDHLAAEKLISDNLRSDLSQMSITLSQERELSSEQARKFRKDIDMLKDTNEKLLSVIQKLQAKNDDLQQVLKDSDDQWKEDMQNKDNYFDMLNAISKSEMSELVAKVDEDKGTITSLTAKISKLSNNAGVDEACMNALKNEVSELTAKVADDGKTLNDLKRETSELTTKVGKDETIIKELTTEVSRLTTKAKEDEATITELTSKFSQQTKTVENDNTTTTALMTEISKLTAKILKDKATMAGLRTEVSLLVKEKVLERRKKIEEASQARGGQNNPY